MTWNPETLAHWARHASDSPLYVELCQVIAADPKLLEVLNEVEHTPAPNILFAAVKLLLGEHPGDPLARYYPHLTDRPEDPRGAGRAFREFVLSNRAHIADIGATRYTQTNECRRATALLPGIWAGDHDDFHLIDIGASAGLNLVLDRYRYRWDGKQWGDSALLLEAELRGADPSPRPITVRRRIGIDLNPLSPQDPDDRAWLEALVWPEDRARLQRLRAALDIAAAATLEMVHGDAADLLGDVLGGLPAGEPAVVMDSFTINQFSPQQVSALDEAVAAARPSRPVHRVSMSFATEGPAEAVLAVDGGAGWRQLGRAHHHGQWLDLYVLP